MTEKFFHYLTPWLVCVAFTYIGILIGFTAHEWTERRERAGASRRPPR